MSVTTGINVIKSEAGSKNKRLQFADSSFGDYECPYEYYNGITY